MEDARTILKKHGMKDALIMKLSDESAKEIVAFAMDHTGSSNLLQMLIQLASMEASGKKGAAYLASNSIASTVQLKQLTAQQIGEISSDYAIHSDIALASKVVKEKIIRAQQEKFSYHGGGSGYHNPYYDAELDEGEELELIIRQ